MSQAENINNEDDNVSVEVGNVPAVLEVPAPEEDAPVRDAVPLLPQEDPPAAAVLAPVPEDRAPNAPVRQVEPAPADAVLAPEPEVLAPNQVVAPDVNPRSFIDHINNMNDEQFTAMSARWNNNIRDLLSPQWNPQGQFANLPNVHNHLTPQVRDSIVMIMDHFNGHVSNVGIETPAGHPPMFSMNGSTRRGILDPGAFTRIPTFYFLDLFQGVFQGQLTHEVTHYQNQRLEMFLVMHMNDQVPFTNDNNSHGNVRQHGLNFHEASLFYFIYSRRRLLAGEAGVVQNVLSYFSREDDIEGIEALMDEFIDAHPEVDATLVEFMDSYVRVIFELLFGPHIPDDYLNIEVRHDQL